MIIKVKQDSNRATHCMTPFSISLLAVLTAELKLRAVRWNCGLALKMFDIILRLCVIVMVFIVLTMISHSLL